jgi:hypothetical protein
MKRGAPKRDNIQFMNFSKNGEEKRGSYETQD